MRTARWRAALAACTLAVGLTACGGDSDSGVDVAVADNPTFAAGTTMARLADAKAIKIGVKFDQPGLGFKEPGADTPTGFDVEVAKIVAGKLGIASDKVQWVETVSANRETFLGQGQVDLVAASYSITDDRKKVIDFGGPYYETGQQLLVRKDSDIAGPENLQGKGVCSVRGSTSIKTVEEKYGAAPKPFGTYSECVDQLRSKGVDAVTTDGAILLGYAAQEPDAFKVVGPAFSTERYGLGIKNDDKPFCEFLNQTLTDAFADGTWSKAFEATLGKSGVTAPTPPKLDQC
jgi:glutamate transport system substrate-binding protein